MKVGKTALGVSLRLQNNALTEFPYDGKETPGTILFVLLVSTREYYRMVKEFLRKIFLDSSTTK